MPLSTSSHSVIHGYLKSLESGMAKQLTCQSLFQTHYLQKLPLRVRKKMCPRRYLRKVSVAAAYVRLFYFFSTRTDLIQINSSFLNYNTHEIKSPIKNNGAVKKNK